MPTSIFDALELIYKHTTPVSAELLPIEESLGRILREDMTATFDLPRFDNSAMDGYAIKCSDAGATVPVSQTIYAGDNPTTILQNHTAIKIMTGAPLPKGTEVIIPIENTSSSGLDVTLPKDVIKGAHIRRAGEDLKSGSVYLHRGSVISAYSIALLASQGVTHVRVSRCIKVAVFGTGDELRPHYEKIEPHQLYNSNTPMFLARTKALGCEVEYIQSSADTIEALESSIRDALHADIIITSGGVSMGDKDFTKDAFLNLGMQIYFDKVDIKPGKPTAFGTLGKTAVINLPGNPLASMVNYEIFVRATIRKMSGREDYHHATLHVPLASTFILRAGKYTVKLGHYDGKSFSPFVKQLPGMLSPLAQANAMMLTAPELSQLQEGKVVKILPIDWEFVSKENEDFITR